MISKRFRSRKAVHTYMSTIKINFQTMIVNTSQADCLAGEPIAMMNHMRIAIDAVFVIEGVFYQMLGQYTTARADYATFKTK